MPQAHFAYDSMAARKEFYPLSNVARTFNYFFNDPSLLEEVFKSKGDGNSSISPSGRSRKGLELLGDSILGTVVKDLLAGWYLDIQTNSIVTISDNFCRNHNLTRIAIKIGLSDYGQVHLDKDSDRHADETYLADLVEAIIGAIYYDGRISKRLQEAITAIEQWVGPHLLDFTENMIQSGDMKESSILIGRLCHLKKQPPPTWRVKRIQEPDKDPRFECHVIWEGQTIGKYTHQSRYQAINKAGSAALGWLTKTLDS